MSELLSMLIDHMPQMREFEISSNSAGVFLELSNEKVVIFPHYSEKLAFSLLSVYSRSPVENTSTE